MHAIREVRNTLKKHRSNQAYLLPFVIGFLLRFYRFPERIGWWGDVASDHLMARHIVRFGELPILGHPASGFTPAFYYPPYFYYIMAGLTAIFDHYIFRIGFFTLLHGFGTVALYFIGKRMGGRAVGFVAAMLYAFSLRMITVAQVSTPPYAVVPILLFLLWRYIEIFGGFGRLGRLGILERWVLHAGLLFATTWYWGVAVFLPLALLAEVMLHGRLREKALAILAFIFLSGIVFLPLLLYFGVFGTVTALLGGSTEHVSFSFGRIVSSIWIFLSDFFFYDVKRTHLAIGTFGLLIAAYGNLAKRRLNHLALPLGLIGLFLGSTVVLSRPLHDHDVHSVQPIFFLVLAGIIVSLYESTASRVRKGIGLASGMFLILLLWDPLGFLQYKSGQYEWYQHVASTIEQGVSRERLSDLRITVVTPSNDTNDHLAIWYVLEEATGSQFLTVVPEGYNFVESTGDGIRALVCLHFTQKELFMCRRRFEDAYSDYSFSRNLLNETDRTMVYMYTRNHSQK